MSYICQEFPPLKYPLLILIIVALYYKLSNFTKIPTQLFQETLTTIELDAYSFAVVVFCFLSLFFLDAADVVSRIKFYYNIGSHINGQ